MNGGETWRDSYIEGSVTPNDGLPASDVNMSVWDFGRKTMNGGEDLIGDITTIKAAERLEKIGIFILSSNRRLDI